MKVRQLNPIFKRTILTGLALVVFFSVRTDAALAQEELPVQTEEKELFTRTQKVLLLNGVVLAGVLGYGLTNWDWGSSNFTFRDENWFSRSSKHGGADKFGHFWTGYAGSHLFSWIYREWGFTDSRANLYGALSVLGMNTVIEISDGFSKDYGFSYEDFIANVLGSAAGYIWGRYPDLANKVDFRIEYTPGFDSEDFNFNTNYERQRFLVAIKAEGFDAIKNPYLKYGELQFGYYARGFDDYDPRGRDDRRRTVFVGLGFNLSRLVQRFVGTKVFNYFQVPYTSFRFDFHLD